MKVGYRFLAGPDDGPGPDEIEFPFYRIHQAIRTTDQLRIDMPWRMTVGVEFCRIPVITTQPSFQLGHGVVFFMMDP